MRAVAEWLLLLLVAAGCSDPTGLLVDPGAVPPPRVHTTLGFGDSPVTGNFIIEPMPPNPAIGPQAPWQFEVDLDDDGEAETAGTASERVTIPYRYEEIGPHRIEVLFTRGSEREQREEFVVVNDPAAIQILGAWETPVGPQNQLMLTGIAVDRNGESVYVAGAKFDEFPEPLYALNSATMTLRDSVDLVGLNGFPEALSTAPDEDLLYVLGKGLSLEMLSIPDLEILRIIRDAPGQFYLQALHGQRAYVSGGVSFSIALVDTRSGNVNREFDSSPNLSGDFAISPDGNQIAFLATRSGSEPNVLHLLTRDLVPIWRADLTEFDPINLPAGVSVVYDAVAFSMSGHRIYLTRVLLGLGRWDFLVLDSDGALLRTITIGHGCDSAGSCRSAGNASALSANGRFAAFTTGLGAIFIDRTLDLPLYGSAHSHPESATYCCNVAAGPGGNEFYFSSFTLGKVTRIQLRD